MNFGTLKNIFVETLIESYTSDNKNGKELYKKFLKTIKESETLKTAFIVFKNIENKTIPSEVKAIEYLKESISLFDNFRGEKSLTTECKKLETLLESYGIDYKSKEVKKLHENLQNLITTQKSVYTLNKLQESKDILNLLEDEDFDISDLTQDELQDLSEKIKLVETSFPNSSSLKKVKNLLQNI
jgi:hypothetical protein